ncbi:hypothetical protein RhiirB3_449855 [Rhizophagus irregularis]|nr:hypothetical protein RhiirB3_449855 [Rhizophagus irregularis]
MRKRALKTDSSQPNNNENIHILFSSSLLLPNPSYFHVPALDENKDNNEYIYYNEEEENDDDEDDGNEDDGDKNDDDENDGDENDGDENNSDEKKKKLFPEYIFYENFCAKPDVKTSAKNSQKGKKSSEPEATQILTGYEAVGEEQEQIQDIIVYDIPYTWNLQKIIAELKFSTQVSDS